MTEFRTYTNDLKNYNINNNFKTNYYVDAKDDTDQWRVAKIISITKDSNNKIIATVRLDGYPSKFNEKYKLPSQKLAPFRKYTPPYTGSAKKPDRQQMGSITQAINSHKEKIQKLLKETNLECELINQYIRGELYIFVDALLCTNTRVKQKEYKQMLSFLQFFIKWGLQIIKVGLGFINQLIEYFNNPMFYLVNPKYAYLLCSVEILDVFSNIIKSSSNVSSRHRFFYNNEENQEVVIKKFKKFMEENEVVELCNTIMGLKIGERNLSWSIRKGALQLLYHLGINIQFPNLDLKDFNELFDLFGFFRQLFPTELVDIKQLNLIYDLITSTIFQRKLKGINELKNLLQKTTKLKLQKIFNIIKQKNLIQYLIDINNFNSQLFKRSVPIFEFYIKNKGFKPEYIQKIVNLAKNRHESEVRLIYSVIADLAKYLSQPFLDLMYSKILELKIDGLIIPLIQDFSHNALLNLNLMNTYTKTYIEKKINIGEKYQFYGLNYLWMLLQDQSQLEAQFINNAIEAFTTLIFVDYFRSEREKYLTLCFKNIQKLVSYGQSIKIVQEIIKISNTNVVGEIIRGIDKQMNIVQLSTSSLNKLIGKNTNGQKIGLDQSIQNYFTFLEQISVILRKSLNLSNIKMFWKIQNKQPLLNFLKKGKEQFKEKQQKTNKFHEKRIQNSLLKELIQNIFMVPQLMNNFQNIDLNVFTTIDELIMTYYIRQRYIDYNEKNTIKVQKLENLDLGFYYKIILNPNKEKVVELAIKRIVECHIRITPQNRSQLDVQNKYALWTQFMQKSLKEIDKNSLIILRIIRYFLEAIQGRMKSLNIFSTAPVVLLVLLKPNDKIKKITLPRCSSVYRLRIAIGEEFEIKNTDFQMKLPNNNDHITDFNFQEDYSLAVITTQGDLPSVIVTPSKQMHPHIKALQKFKENISQNRLETLYELLDKVSEQQLVILFEILNRLPKLKSLERKFQKFEITQNDWNSVLSGVSIRKLYYQLSILQTNKNLKNAKWVIQFIQKKGFQHMINIFLKIEESSFSNPFSVRCYSSFITVLAEFLKFAAKSIVISKNEIFFQHTVKLLIASIEKSNEQTPDFTNNCFRLLNGLISVNAKFLRSLFENKKIKNILEYCIFFKENINKQFPVIFLDGLKKQIEDPFNRNMILSCLINNFLLVKYLDTQRKNCQTYFSILIKIIKQIPKAEWKEKNNIIIQSIINFIQNARKISYLEKSSNDFDALLNGWLSLISVVLKKSAISIETLLQEKQYVFANYLLNQCLFPPKGKSESAKCKSNRNRNEAFNLLGQLQSAKQYSIKQISNLLVPILNKSTWRRSGQWSIVVSNQKNSDFKGLKNLAATCYINSLMQQLFSITEFRQNLLKVQSAGGPQDILFQVQQIFSFLKYSQRATYTPRSFCNTFILEGQPIDPRMQMDADEFFNHLMDKLDINLKSIKNQFIINNSFQGQISNQIICKDCPHQSQRNEDYLTLGVTIKNKKSLELALKQFIQGEMLDGDNAYYCEKCEKKVKCLKRACIKQLPNILIIVLKRFQFDYDAMEKIKLNDYCEFPLKLDMKPYTKEYLKKLQKPDQQNLKPDSYYLYDLKGTVIHYGTSEAGHYYSYIKTDNNNWYQFNDEIVQKFDLSQLANQAYGGTQESQFIENEEKCKNAYILFYQRSKYYLNNEQTPYMITPINVSESKKPSKAYEIVNEDNLKNQYIRVAFDNSLIEYLNSSISNKENRFLMLYTHLVIFRSRDRNAFIFEYFNRVQKELTTDASLCDWYINNITENFIKEFLMDAPKEVKYSVLYFIYLALKLTKPNIQFIKRCISLVNRRGNSPFAKIFYLMTTQNKQYTKILNENDHLQRTYRMIVETEGANSTIYSKIIQTKTIKSEFGQAVLVQESRREDPIYDCLIQSLQNYNLKFEDVRKLILKGRNYRIARNTLSKMISRGVKNKENFQKFCISYLTTELSKGEQQKQMILCLRIMKELININDDYTQQRHKRLSDIHLNALKQSLYTYQPFNLLLQALFRFCFSNLNYRNRVLINFSQNKSMIKSIRTWISESSVNSVISNIKSQKWSFWRKPILTNNIISVFSNMQNNDSHFIKKKEERQSRFNGLLEKHNITIEQPLEDIDYQKGQKYEYINNLGKVISFEVLNKMGYLYHIKIDGGIRWHSVDDQLP